MLVLSRKPGEEILIDGEIRVRVVEVSGNRVKLALAAPGNVPIMRGELARAAAEERFAGDDELVLTVG